MLSDGGDDTAPRFFLLAGTVPNMAFNNNDGDSGLDDEAVETYEPPYDAERGCPKCGCPETRVGDVATQGGGTSVALDVPSNYFRCVTCLGCGYSELYRPQGHSYAESDSDSSLVETFLE